MNINIIFSSYPEDGLFFYSYEHYCFLNDAGINTKFVIFLPLPSSKKNFIDMLISKYKNVRLDKIFFIDGVSRIHKFDGVNLLMGSSHLHQTYRKVIRRDYSLAYKVTLRAIMSNKTIVIYNKNRPEDDQQALDFFKPKELIVLNDSGIYPDTEGIEYRKFINFSEYKPIKKPTDCYVFNGTNPTYYERVKKVISGYKNSKIIVREHIDDEYRDIQIKAPVKDLHAQFNKYVYTKDYFDPAPRLIQECFYYNKEVIYDRDPTFVDGGSVYYNLGKNGHSFDIKDNPNIADIINAL